MIYWERILVREFVAPIRAGSAGDGLEDPALAIGARIRAADWRTLMTFNR